MKVLYLLVDSSQMRIEDGNSPSRRHSRRTGTISVGLEIKCKTPSLLKGVASSICPIVRPLLAAYASTLAIESSSLATSAVSQDTKGLCGNGVSVPASVVVNIDFLGVACTARTGKGTDLEGERTGAHGQESDGLGEMHGEKGKKLKPEDGRLLLGISLTETNSRYLGSLYLHGKFPARFQLHSL